MCRLGLLVSHLFSCLVVGFIVGFFLSLIIFHCKGRKTLNQTVLPCKLSLCDIHLLLFCAFVSNFRVPVGESYLHCSLRLFLSVSIARQMHSAHVIKTFNYTNSCEKKKKKKKDGCLLIQKDRFSNLSGPLSPPRQRVVIQVVCVCHRE